MKRSKKIVVGVVVAVLLMWLFRATILPPVAWWLDVGRPPQEASHVFVLPGDVQTRPFVAADIVNKGYARAVLVPELYVDPNDEQVTPPQHEIIAAVVEKLGVDPERVTILPGKSRSTFSDIAALARFLKQHPDAHVLVVTNGYHTRRTRWVLHRVLGDRAAQVRLLSAPPDDFDMDRWWETPEGFLHVTSEYLKLGFYWARYGG